MVKVKICGITRLKDAESALESGADALGFVFAPSPRRIAVEEARKIISALGPWVVSVGVFVNEEAGVVRRTAEFCGLSAVQLHGDEPPGVLKRLKGLRVIKAFRIAEAKDLKAVDAYAADAFLFDAKIEGLFGGSGKSFSWDLLKGRRFKKPFIVSGGLTAGNVGRVVRALSPYGVDVSSGVESSPGIKNKILVREFIRNAKKT